MSDEKNPPVRYLGTYFDRDMVLKVAHWANILAWVGAGIYLVTWLLSFGQFLFQFSNGFFYSKGISILDLANYFTPYLQQPLPGVLYFFSMQGISHGLRIFLDVEDNGRRAARN